MYVPTSVLQIESVNLVTCLICTKGFKQALNAPKLINVKESNMAFRKTICRSKMMASLQALPGKFYNQSKSHYTSTNPDETTLTRVAFKTSAFVLHMQPLFDLCAYALLCSL